MKFGLMYNWKWNICSAFECNMHYEALSRGVRSNWKLTNGFEKWAVKVYYLILFEYFIMQNVHLKVNWFLGMLGLFPIWGRCRENEPHWTLTNGFEKWGVKVYYLIFFESFIMQNVHLKVNGFFWGWGYFHSEANVVKLNDLKLWNQMSIFQYFLPLFLRGNGIATLYPNPVPKTIGNPV